MHKLRHPRPHSLLYQLQAVPAVGHPRARSKERALLVVVSLLVVRRLAQSFRQQASCDGFSIKREPTGGKVC